MSIHIPLIGLLVIICIMMDMKYLLFVWWIRSPICSSPPLSPIQHLC